ncbi:hypothetical protein ACO0QE_004806 [Hanseniaspora vineae]
MSTNADWAKGIPCRYITLYGFCKNEHNGCPYSHKTNSEFKNTAGASEVDPTTRTEAEIAVAATAATSSSSKAIPAASTSILESSLLTSVQPPQENQTTSSTVAPKVAASPKAKQMTKGESAINELKKAVSALKVGNSAAGTPSVSTPAASTSSKQFDPLNSPVFTPVYKPTSMSNNFVAASNSVPEQQQTVQQSSFNPYAENFVPTHGLQSSFDQMDPRSFTNGSIPTSNTPIFVNPSAPSTMGNPLQMSPGANQLSVLTGHSNYHPQQQQQQPQPQPQQQPQQQQQIPGQSNIQLGNQQPFQPSQHPMLNHLHQSAPMTPIGMMGSPSQGTLLTTANDMSTSYVEHHLYNPDPPPHRKVPLEPHQRTPEMLFISNTLRIDLLDKKKDLANVQPHNVPGLPSVLNDYFNISFLYATDANNFFYKCVSNYDGLVCLIHRIANYTNENLPQPKKIASVYQACSKVHSSNVVQLKDVFLTTQFNDRSVCLVYKYHPLTISINDYYRLDNQMGSSLGLEIEEEYLWLYLVQIANAMRKLHTSGLYFGDMLDWHNFLITSIPGRIKYFGLGRNCFGSEALKIKELQQQDFKKLGEMLETVITPKMRAGNPEFQNILDYLLTETSAATGALKSVSEFVKIFAVKFFDIMENLQTQNEDVEQTLANELENARLFRLMCKMNAVINRPDSNSDINWSENGSKYPLKLFYHYVFHQKDHNGKKTLDLVHVLKTLNKLDAGVAEKILLVTPDEMNCMLISYKELKILLEFSFKNIA